MALKKLAKGNFIISAAVKEGSMLPLIKRTAQLTIDVKTRRYWPGDIVILFLNNQLVAHRILEGRKKNQLFLLKGDNNLRADGWFPASKIIGKLVKIRYPNYVIDLETPKWCLLKQIFLFHSRLNGQFPFLRKLHHLYKIPFLKSFYRYLVGSQTRYPPPRRNI